jgi:DNA polymerase-3 subunit delta'
MGDWRVIGHEWAVDFLTAGLRHGRTRHAYLITGGQNIGKRTFAHSFAAALNCTHEAVEQRPCWECRSCKWVLSGNHPDLIYATNDEITGAIRIDAVREVIQQLALKPFIARCRIALFDEFDRAAPRTQDALLKTIEEPPPHAVILLLAQRSEHILPTIRSRCQALPLRPAPTERVRQLLVERGASDEQATLLARLSSGRVGWALQALENPDVLEDRDNILNLLSEAVRGSRLKRFNIAEMISAQATKDRDALRYLLEMWQTYWRDVVLYAYGAPTKPCNTDRLVEIQQWAQRIPREAALQALQATRRTLYVTLETNASVRLALEALMLAYPYY